MLENGLSFSDWKQLAHLCDEVLATYDIALVNLACTAGLPDAPTLSEIRECFLKLDEWTKFVRRYTELSYEQFFLTNPAQYGHSEAFFRSLCLVTALQRHCGLRYNPAKIPENVPLETADTFIHGAILGEGGTCASIPVVLAAVGRRLGYPIKIVETKTTTWEHLFARWDDPNGVKINLEATNKGLTTPDDDYYRMGFYALDPETEKAGQFLKSKTPREELAVFLSERAICWRRLRHWRFMAEAYGCSISLAPANGFYLNTLKTDMNTWRDEHEKLKPPGFPDLYVETLARHFPVMLPLEIEHDILGRTALENVLRDPELNYKYWEPMRRGVRLSRVPVRILARFHPRSCDVMVEFSARG